MKKVVNSVIDLIGNTPIVKLNRLTPKGTAEVYVKLEFFNPGSSVKDRVALAMIEQAEKDGKIQPGDTIIEATSGNTGIGLALIGAAKGYKVIIVMPDTMSEERKKIISAYGAELILTPGSEGMKGSIAQAKKLSEEKKYFMPLQFANEANPTAHEVTTGNEILEAFDGKPIDVFVAGVGTGGTITGVAHALKRSIPSIEIIAVEPEESAVLQNKKAGPHKIQGIGAGFIPTILDNKAYDKVMSVNSDDAMKMAREVAKKEGILVGISAGAAISAGIEVAKQLPSSKKVLIIVPDNGERYLTTELFTSK